MAGALQIPLPLALQASLLTHEVPYLVSPQGYPREGGSRPQTLFISFQHQTLSCQLPSDMIAGGPGKDGSVGKHLLCKHEGPEFDSQQAKRGMVVPACSPSAGEAEAGGCLGLSVS